MTWLERLARRSVANDAAPSALPAPTPAPSNPASRRDFMKKAAVVGGLAWAAPVLQSVVVPAAAASGGLVLGDSCSFGTQVCSDSACSPSGICGGPGADCTAGACLYGNCFNGVCGAPGAKCRSDSACVYGSIERNCFQGVCGGQAARCLVNANCAPGFECKKGKCKKEKDH
jgi:hypothetical protein